MNRRKGLRVYVPERLIPVLIGMLNKLDDKGSRDVEHGEYDEMEEELWLMLWSNISDQCGEPRLIEQTNHVYRVSEGL